MNAFCFYFLSTVYCFLCHIYRRTLCCCWVDDHITEMISYTFLNFIFHFCSDVCTAGPPGPPGSHGSALEDPRNTWTLLPRPRAAELVASADYDSQNSARGARAVLGSLGRGAAAAIAPPQRVWDVAKPLDKHWPFPWNSEGTQRCVGTLRRGQSGWVMASIR